MTEGLEQKTVYCSFVDTVVPVDKLNDHCPPIVGGKDKCCSCKKSPQIELGMPVADLIRQMRG